MIVRGIIEWISSDFKTCKVYVPAFAPAGSSKVVLSEVLFATNPGIYAGYKVNDAVFVAFEENNYQNPIVIGKLFVDKATESKIDIALGNLSANSLNVKELKINNIPFNFSDSLASIFTGLLSKNSGSAEKENYENLVDKFIEYNIDQQDNLKIYPKAQIGTFGIKAINSKEPKLIRQEFVLDSPGDTSIINFTSEMKIATLVKINLNDTFLVTDKLTLSPGYYESGTQQFEVKVDLENKQINIKTSGITDIKKIYITTEYWN